MVAACNLDKTKTENEYPAAKKVDALLSDEAHGARKGVDVATSVPNFGRDNFNTHDEITKAHSMTTDGAKKLGANCPSTAGGVGLPPTVLGSCSADLGEAFEKPPLGAKVPSDPHSNPSKKEKETDRAPPLLVVDTVLGACIGRHCPGKDDTAADAAGNSYTLA